MIFCIFGIMFNVSRMLALSDFHISNNCFIKSKYWFPIVFIIIPSYEFYLRNAYTCSFTDAVSLLCY